MRIDVVTIFPDYLDPLRQSLPGKAIDAGIIALAVHDLRRWTYDVHRSVGDAPDGSAPGLWVMAPGHGDEDPGLGGSARRNMLGRNASRGADAGGQAFHPSRRRTMEHREA